MKSRIRLFIYTMMFLLMFIACGHKKEQELDTEKLVVGAGLAFESEDSVTSEPAHFDMELTAADLEGMTESVVRAVKNASIYSKPSTEASIVGAVDAGMNIGIYGLTEDQTWMVVSFNGRVGYVKANVFEREVVQTQTVIVPTQPTNSNQRPSAGNQNTNAGSSNNSSTTSPNTQKPNTGGTENNNTTNPPSSDVGDSSENTPTDTPTDTPSDLPSDIPSDPPSGGDEGTTDTPGGGDENEETTEPPTEDGGEDSGDTGSGTPDLPSDGEDSNEGVEPPQDSTESPEIPDGIEEISEGTAE